jgi:tRNA G18 (ribose-2'-O)-methylase SpoU
LRFPVQEDSELGESCPLCGETTAFIDEAWETPPAPAAGELPGPRLHALLDNVRSLRNVGAVFRTADGAGVDHLHLCGFTPTPAHPKLAKTALGAEQHVAWTRHFDALRAVDELQNQGVRVWALEGGDEAESVFEVAESAKTQDSPIVLVLGHEVSGVDVRVLDRCERRVCVPMAGIKGSLNVSVAFGVAAFTLRHALHR